MIQVVKGNGTLYSGGVIQIINKYGKPKTPFVPIVWGTITGTLSAQTDLQNALNLKEDKINKGLPNGYASLNGAGLVPSSQLPSYVDDIVEVANYAALPMPGETGKIYVTLDTNEVYRWSGSVYIEIAANPAVWGTITGTVTAQTDLTSYISSNYYPLVTNPAGYITSAALAPYLTSATAASTYYPLTNPNGYISGITSGMVTTALGFTPYDAANPAGYITSSALTPYLLSSTAASTYYPLTNPAGYITASALTLYLTTADAASTYYPLTNPAGYITASSLTGYVPYTGATANVDLGIYKLVTPLVDSTGGLTLNATGNIGLKSYNSSIATFATNSFSFFPVAVSSGFSTTFTFTKPNNTNQTASANILGWNYQGGSRQWLAGTIANQTENVWGAVTYSFTSASTITKAIGNVFNAPIAGTNATITDNFAAQFNGRIELLSSMSFNNGTDSMRISRASGALGRLAFSRPGNEAVDSVTFGGGNEEIYIRSGAGKITHSGPEFQIQNSTGATGLGLFASAGDLNLYGNSATNAVRVFGGTRNVTIQNGGTFTDNGYRLEVVGLSNFTDRVAINYPSLSAIYKLGVGGSAVVKGSIVIQDDSGNFSAYSSDGSIQSGGFSFNRYVGVNIYSSNTNPIKLSVNSAEALRIFNGGNISIGSTTDAGYKFHVTGTGNFTDRVNIGNYATPSSLRMFTVGQDTAFVSIGSLPGATNYGAIFINQATPAIANAAMFATSGAVTVQGTAQVYLRAGGYNIALLEQGKITVNPGVYTTGAVTPFTFTNPTNTGQTASTSIAGWNYNGGSRTWLAGAIGTQSENIWGAVTYNFNGASVITNAYGNVFNAPIAGLNCTITNNWAAQFNGNVVIGSTGQLFQFSTSANNPSYTQTGATGSSIYTVSGSLQVRMQSFSGGQNWLFATGGRFLYGTSDAQPLEFYTNNTKRFEVSGIGSMVFYQGTTYTDGANIAIATTTGTKIGTATTQKLSFWNATPIVQPANTTSLNGVLENTGLMASGSTVSTINKPLVVGANTTPRTGVATDGVTSVLGDLQNFTTEYHSGEVLYSEVSGEALNFGQLCWRDRFGKWQLALGNVAGESAYNMLGICLHTVGAADTAISILTRGYVETTYIAAGRSGDPLFMDATTAGSIVNAQPSAAGNVVRIIGNLFWANSVQTNGKWILYFNPDNTWIEL